MPKSALHLVKLCVGIDSVAQLEAYRADQRRDASANQREDLTTHVTRMWPRRAGELLNGGSLYWVIKGVIQARQRILRFEERIGHDGIRRCAIIMSPKIIRTQNAQRRPFQGWRYLDAKDSPPDLFAENRNADELPAELQQALSEIGLR